MKRVTAICCLIVVMGGKHVHDSLLEMHNELKQSFPLARIPRSFLEEGWMGVCVEQGAWGASPLQGCIRNVILLSEAGEGRLRPELPSVLPSDGWLG